MARLKPACRTSGMTGEQRMVGPAENLVAARRYIKAIESGARGDELAQFFAPEAVVEISSQPLLSQRQTRQKYEIKNELSSGDTVALEIFWTRTLAVPFQSRPAG